jgi:hypothetical protein
VLLERHLIQVAGIVFCIGLVVGGLASNRVTALHFENKAEKLAAEHRQAVDNANQNAYAAAELYEESKKKRRIQVVTVTREIERASTSDPCGQQPVSDGLRDAVTRAANADTAEPPGPVPGVPAARTYDLGQSGGGLGGSVRRLFGSATGTE